ncbi:hypothetical protein GDO78_006970 [Eleutherodactylus coqui]|uniref:Uncharacterized protein n=1 Tax=Eleutherodactylus coqui TaxID=57060 RepID=A0A8J6KAJ8_ELECQ|nr:hypothetical protein GDO78_006970 [Eleutherodactylus coqui]
MFIQRVRHSEMMSQHKKAQTPTASQQWGRAIDKGAWSIPNITKLLYTDCSQARYIYIHFHIGFYISVSRRYHLAPACCTGQYYRLPWGLTVSDLRVLLYSV